MAEKETMNSREVMSALSDVIASRSALHKQVNGLPERDLDKELRYPDKITIKDYKKQFDRGGIGTRVVSIMPDESWAVMPKLIENEEVELSEFESKWLEIAETTHPFYYLHRADILSGIGRFGIILIGIDDGKDLSQPVDGVTEDGKGRAKKEHEITYYRVFDESVVSIKKKQTDVTSRRYQQPLLYSINFSEKKNENSSKDKQDVHWSRVIHLADNRLQSEVYGTPRMKPVYNRLLDIKKILGGSGEMFWRGAFPGYAFEADPELLMKGGEVDVASLKDELYKFSEGLQRYLALSGVSAKSLSPQAVTPTEHLNAQLKAIALTMGIPYRILFGTEEARLAGEKDDEHWRMRMGRRQKNYLTPMVVKPFSERLIQYNVLPEPKETNYTVQWPTLKVLSEQEEADLSAKKTEALRRYMHAGVREILPPEEFFKFIMRMPAPEVKVIMEALEKAPRFPETEEGGQPGEGERGGSLEPSHEGLED